MERITKSSKQYKRRIRFQKTAAVIAVLLIALALIWWRIDKRNRFENPIGNNDSAKQESSSQSKNDSQNLKEPSKIKGSDEKNNFKNEENAESQNSSSTKKSDWNLVLVNPKNTLPEDFSVSLKELANGHVVDERVYPSLQKMMDDARAKGLKPLICSSYRTMEKQKKLYNNLVKKYQNEGFSEDDAKTEAAKWVAVPGTSEHQCGLAVDIVSADYQLLNKEQENTAEQQWLMKNCYKYGFILRYPEDKVDITGIGYEPWHYRYVGEDAAKEIFEQKICLEEYLANRK
ncbi:MAG: M15 family metallopeptidase [Peptostreptococcaceae bacterium]|nr:M15 family metallopeptidase [Peptostreptococcaceae bacterium]